MALPAVSLHRRSLARDLALALVAVFVLSACPGGAALITSSPAPTTPRASVAALGLRFIEILATGAQPAKEGNQAYRFGLGTIWEGELRDSLQVRSSACFDGVCAWGREDRDGETHIIVFVPGVPPPGTHQVSLTFPDGRTLVAALPLAVASAPPVAQASPSSPATPASPPPSFALRLIESVAPGVAPNTQPLVMYRFATGIPRPDLSTDQLRAAIRLPSVCSATIGCGFGDDDTRTEWVIRVYMAPEAPPGPHVLGLTLPDGRIAQTQFMAVGTAAPPVAASPTPTPSVAPAPVAQTYTVRGRVTDAATGAPVASVTVVTRAFDASGDARRVTQPPRGQTGVEGTYVVAVPRDPAVSFY